MRQPKAGKRYLEARKSNLKAGIYWPTAGKRRAKAGICRPQAGKSRHTPEKHRPKVGKRCPKEGIGRPTAEIREPKAGTRPIQAGGPESPPHIPHRFPVQSSRERTPSPGWRASSEDHTRCRRARDLPTMRKTLDEGNRIISPRAYADTLPICPGRIACGSIRC